MTNLDFTRGLATAAHFDKVELDGAPYIGHLDRVASVVAPPYRRLAYLHDIVEDTDWTLADLRRLGYDEPFLDDLALLTRPPLRSPRRTGYIAWVEHIIASGRARPIAVKLCDVADHLRPGCEDVVRPDKLVTYRQAHALLVDWRHTHEPLVHASVLVWAAIAAGRWAGAKIGPADFERATRSITTDAFYCAEVLQSAWLHAPSGDLDALRFAATSLHPGLDV